MPNFSHLTFDLEPSLPDPAIPFRDWSLESQCRLGAGYYNALHNQNAVSLIRTFGHDAAYAAHQASARHHQQSLFLPGLEKLGLDGEPSDAVRCAKYHCFSNALGGVVTRYAIESPKKA